MRDCMVLLMCTSPPGWFSCSVLLCTGTPEWFCYCVPARPDGCVDGTGRLDGFSAVYRPVWVCWLVQAGLGGLVDVYRPAWMVLLIYIQARQDGSAGVYVPARPDGFVAVYSPAGMI